MPYYNRYEQLINTLDSIKKTRWGNFDVTIVDDASTPILEIDKGYMYPIEIIHISKYEKDTNNWAMPLPQMNKAMKKVIDNGADIVMLQNCECRHVGDLVCHAVDNVTEKNYLSYSCFSLSRKSTFDPDIDNKILDIIKENDRPAVDSEHDSWYNHPVHRGTGYDFCASITAGNLKELNGYDERYCHNYCYGDDDFIMRIKRLGLFIDIPTIPVVLHQWHGLSWGKRQGMEKNGELYNSIAKNETGFKAKHLYTPDL